MIAIKHKKRFFIALGSALLLIMIGAFFFLSDITYYEKEQLYYMLGFLLFSGAFFFFMLRLHYVKAGFVTLLMLSLIVLSTVKYDWRKDFITQIDYGQKTLLLEQIAKFPSYESYMIAQFQGAPDWVGFSNDCLKPALAEQKTGPSCQSLQAIGTAYRINLPQELKNQFQRMKYTVQQIERGRFRNKRQYVSCINQKRCAPVPLLPVGVKAEDIDPRSDEHLEVRKIFWEIAGSRELTKEICAVNGLCSALDKMGVLDLRTSQQVNEELEEQNSAPASMSTSF